MSGTHSVISALFFLLAANLCKVDAASSTTLHGSRTTAAPSGPVITIAVLGSASGTEPLVGSLIGITSQLTTVAAACPAGIDTNYCVLVGDATITAGPSTVALTMAIDQGMYTVKENCQFSSGGGLCTIVAPALLLGPGSDTTISTSSDSVAPTDIANVRIIITAGNTAGLVSAATTSHASGSASPTSSGGSVTSTSSTSTKNDANALAAGGMGAALLGLAAVLL